MFHKAERNFRSATTPIDQLRCLEEMLRLLPKHKGTNKLQADLKRKISEKRSYVADRSATAPKGASQKIAKQGCAQVAVIGPPNGGKSQLVASLTDASTNVAPFPYTTRSMQAGMMSFEDVAVQLVDTPPLASGTLDSSLLNLVRSADLNLFCFDGSDDDAIDHAAVAISELTSRTTYLSDGTTISIEGTTRRACRSRLLLTRSLNPDSTLRLELLQDAIALTLPVIRFDLSMPEPFAAVRSEIFDSLDLVRVYTKKPGEPVDRDNPFTLPTGATVLDVAAKVHASLPNRFRDARVWQRLPSTEAPETNTIVFEHSKTEKTVGHEYPVRDGDIIELRTK